MEKSIKNYFGIGVRKGVKLESQGLVDLSILAELKIRKGTNKTLIAKQMQQGENIEKYINNVKQTLLDLGVQEKDILGIYNFLA